MDVRKITNRNSSIKVELLSFETNNNMAFYYPIRKIGYTSEKSFVGCQLCVRVGSKQNGVRVRGTIGESPS